MNRILKSFSILLLLVALGCSEAPDGEVSEMAALSDVEFENLEQDNAVSNLPTERKLIKDGSLSFETEDISGTRKRVNEAIKSTDAYVANEEEGNYRGRLEITLVIRVPAENFDQLVNAISQGVEVFDHKSIDVKDVTEEYLDISSRL